MKARLLFLGSATAALAPTTLAGDECSSSKSWAATTVSEKPTIVEAAVSAGEFTTLAKALTAAGLVDTLNAEGSFTVFAPTDAAFAKLPEGTLAQLLEPENRARLTSILTYHVVPGSVRAADVVNLEFAETLNGQRVDIRVEEGEVRVDGAAVQSTDILCSNGVIHVIDNVILPNTKDVVDTAVEAGSFKTLAAALKAAGLVEALRGEGPFTVFAPTDEAFAALPEGTLESLLKPENREQLVAILKYHVVSGRVYSDQAAKAGSAATLEGRKIRVTPAGGGLKVNQSKVTIADLETANGVIHVIDRVLLPQ